MAHLTLVTDMITLPLNALRPETCIWWQHIQSQQSQSQQPVLLLWLTGLAIIQLMHVLKGQVLRSWYTESKTWTHCFTSLQHGGCFPNFCPSRRFLTDEVIRYLEHIININANHKWLNVNVSKSAQYSCIPDLRWTGHLEEKLYIQLSLHSPQRNFHHMHRWEAFEQSQDKIWGKTSAL